jgi:hypothetical protein
MNLFRIHAIKAALPPTRTTDYSSFFFWLLQNPKDQEQQETRPFSPPLLIITCSRLRLDLSWSGDSRKEEGDEIAAAQAPGLRPPPQQQGGEGPPPAKLDELAYAAQVPEFFSVHYVARCRARMRAKIGGITRQLRFRRFFPSFCIYTFFFAIFGHCWVR